ncbi:response regulator [Niabella yanshanensis]|uniref:histidine kinase n=1 Tax=Niabella yanshanensis TaxID=577386 RepID=A0ABZ0W7M8_9BACT|nr:response regulator [Niabella yanshanensis]WQD38020.1 response regulator [Niabella yanshanensis]
MCASNLLKSLHRPFREPGAEHSQLHPGTANAGRAVSAPPEAAPLFDKAQEVVQEYFRNLKMDPSRGTIEVNEQRFVLVRASALSKDFLETVLKLYADRGKEQAMEIGKNFLFDIAHAIGMNDARSFHQEMKLSDPLAKLSAGPIHFAFSGWAYVEISPESQLSPDEHFFLLYHHPYSFEADSWLRDNKKANTTVCIMNAGYSSGWCEESFGIPLTAVEVSCVAKGDDRCRFIMSPPDKIEAHLNHYFKNHKIRKNKKRSYTIPTFFDRKRVEEELERSRLIAEESAKVKSDFIATVSHELRTPLNAITGFSNLLRKTKLTPKQKEYLDIITHSGNNLLSIINDVLDLSRMDAGGFNIDTVPFHLGQLIDSSKVMFDNISLEKQISFQKNISDDCDIMVIGDPVRLSQILMNLIGNAFKFTEKGTVTLTCKLIKNTGATILAEFSIKDTGIGIPTDKLNLIFERFKQIDTDFTRLHKGFGLGLAITKKLVELQGGIISVKSKPGKGSHFTFSLPYLKYTDAKKLKPTKRKPSVSLPSSVKQILLIEDNVLNQKLTSAVLKNRNSRVTIANNGLEALALLDKQQFDIIIMDIQMPVMNGYEVARRIRRIMQLNTPIIAMTAHVLPGEKAKCLKAGMNDYLPKPFNEEELILKITQLAQAHITLKQQHIKERVRMLDLTMLARQTKNKRPLMNEMIATLNRELPVLMKRLSSAIDKDNSESIYKAAHNLRGAISLFGLPPQVSNNLLSLEKNAYAKKKKSNSKILYQQIEPLLLKAKDEAELLSVKSKLPIV